MRKRFALSNHPHNLHKNFGLINTSRSFLWGFQVFLLARVRDSMYPMITELPEKEKTAPAGGGHGPGGMGGMD